MKEICTLLVELHIIFVDSPLHIVALAQTYNDTKQFQLTIYYYKEDYKMLGSSLSR